MIRHSSDQEFEEERAKGNNPAATSSSYMILADWHSISPPADRDACLCEELRGCQGVPGLAVIVNAAMAQRSAADRGLKLGGSANS